MYDGENTMLLGDYYCDEVAGGVTEDEDKLPEHWDDTWDRKGLAWAVFNVGDTWFEEMKPADRECVIDRLADFLGFALMGYDFAWDADASAKYKAGCVTVVRGMLNPGYDAEDMVWKWLARMFADDDFDSSDEESSFFEWFKKKYEDESWSWVSTSDYQFKHSLQI